MKRQNLRKNLWVAVAVINEIGSSFLVIAFVIALTTSNFLENSNIYGSLPTPMHILMAFGIVITLTSIMILLNYLLTRVNQRLPFNNLTVIIQILNLVFNLAAAILAVVVGIYGLQNDVYDPLFQIPATIATIIIILAELTKMFILTSEITKLTPPAAHSTTEQRERLVDILYYGLGVFKVIALIMQIITIWYTFDPGQPFINIIVLLFITPAVFLRLGVVAFRTASKLSGIWEDSNVVQARGRQQQQTLQLQQDRRQLQVQLQVMQQKNQQLELLLQRQRQQNVQTQQQLQQQRDLNDALQKGQPVPAASAQPAFANAQAITTDADAQGQKRVRFPAMPFRSKGATSEAPGATATASGSTGEKTASTPEKPARATPRGGRFGTGTRSVRSSGVISRASIPIPPPETSPASPAHKNISGESTSLTNESAEKPDDNPNKKPDEKPESHS